MELRTHWVTIKDGFREYDLEVVNSIDDLALAFDAKAKAKGVELDDTPVANARSTMMVLAHQIKYSTVGDVLQVEYAYQMLSDALTQAGIGSTLQ
ncbi:hypothetical protein [Methylobacterium sp.]|uniref:hypothetical protein n=1 Tax=Methylobacterium sp. TaxID=409 RepID=UPI003B01C867